MAGQFGAGPALAVPSSHRGCPAKVAVGQERAHTELLSQGEGLAVVVFGWLDLGGITMRSDLAEEAQGPRLVAPFLVRTGEIKGLHGAGVGLLQAAGQ